MDNGDCEYRGGNLVGHTFSRFHRHVEKNSSVRDHVYTVPPLRCISTTKKNPMPPLFYPATKTPAACCLLHPANAKNQNQTKEPKRGCHVTPHGTKKRYMSACNPHPSCPPINPLLNATLLLRSTDRPRSDLKSSLSLCTVYPPLFLSLFTLKPFAPPAPSKSATPSTPPPSAPVTPAQSARPDPAES